MNPSLRKDRILSVHQFIHKNSKRVGIEGVCFHTWISFEISVVEIRHICFLLQLLSQLFVQGNWFPYFRDAVFNVDIFDIEHAQTFDGRILNDFQRFKEGVEEKLYLIFFQSN